MLPKRKRHACMLVSAGAAPGRLRESREVLAWLPRLQMLVQAKKLSNPSISPLASCRGWLIKNGCKETIVIDVAAGRSRIARCGRRSADLAHADN